MALVTEREACVAGVESYSGPQGTLASPESLRSVPWHSRHSLEPLGTMYWTLIMYWAQFWLFTHIFGFDSWNPWGGYCPCWLNKSECFDNKSQSWALCPVFLGPIPSASLEGRRERRSSLYHRQGRVAEGKGCSLVPGTPATLCPHSQLIYFCSGLGDTGQGSRDQDLQDNRLLSASGCDSGPRACGAWTCGVYTLTLGALNIRGRGRCQQSWRAALLFMAKPCSELWVLGCIWNTESSVMCLRTFSTFNSITKGLQLINEF